jgi:Ala-tRNA(Pro) deacylase
MNLRNFRLHARLIEKDEEVFMPSDKLLEHLKSHNVKYETIKYSPVYTAQEIAAATHIPGKQLAKSVMLKIDGVMAMAVLPASFQINFKRLKEATGTKKIELANEQEFKALFPDCELGAMPPFGNLYGMDVYVDKNITKEVQIGFCSGMHGELIVMSYADFEDLVNPKVISYSN